MNGKDGVPDEIQKTGHKGVVQATEMRAITHLLGEDIHRIDFPGDMFNVNSLILHPLANGVLTKFDVAGSF